MDKKSTDNSELSEQHSSENSDQSSMQTDSSEDTTESSDKLAVNNDKAEPESVTDTESEQTDVKDNVESDETESLDPSEDDQTPVSKNEGDDQEEFSDDLTADEDDDASDAEDLSSMSTDQLVELIEKFADAHDLLDKRGSFNQVRSLLRDIFHEEFEDNLQAYLDNGGERDDYKPVNNPLNERYHKAVKKFQKRKEEVIKNREKELQQNLAKKKDILDEMRIVAEQEENIGRAFERFRILQEQWRAIGPVPIGEVRDLQLNYRFLNDLFFNHVNMNRELQELDQKKNLEVKTSLCEEAESLINEPSLNTAFAKMDALQQSWREVGMVPLDVKDDIWQRFINARKVLIEKRKEYIAQRESRKEENLEKKTRYCEEVEAITPEENWKHKDWQSATDILLYIQKQWRKVGPAPDKVNDEIWKRFREASNKLFKAKNNFYQDRKKVFADNLKQKVAICEEAEKLMNSTEWKNTAAELIKLQKDWKKIGPVGDKQSDKVWKRFRAACDTFFNNRSEHFNEMDKANEENLAKKLELLEKIEGYEHVEDAKAVISELRNFQEEWASIGFVPIKKKEEIQERYRKAIDSHYDKLKLDRNEKQKLRYQQKLESIRAEGNPKKLDGERRFLRNKINELNSEVQTLENNIGFFGQSKGAEQMKADFEKKIRKAKEEISTLKEKLKLLG
jgi:hypothetical protein